MPVHTPGESSDGYNVQYVKPMGFKQGIDEVWLQIRKKGESGEFEDDPTKHNAISGYLTKIETNEYEHQKKKKIGVKVTLEYEPDKERLVLSFSGMTWGCRELLNRLSNCDAYGLMTIGVYCFPREDGTLSKGVYLKNGEEKVQIKTQWKDLMEKYVTEKYETPDGPQNDYRNLDAIFFRLLKEKIAPRISGSLPPSAPPKEKVGGANTVTSQEHMDQFEKEAVVTDKDDQSTMFQPDKGPVAPMPTEDDDPAKRNKEAIEAMEEDDLPF